MRKRSVVLLSGGLDSATVAWLAASEGYDIFAMTFRYGQRHEVEVRSARSVAERLGVSRHVVVDIDLRTFGGSALTSELTVPKDRDVSQIGQEIPVTYVPARNTIFLAFATAWAEALECDTVFIGANVVDYSGYPDCRPEYLEAFERMANLATKRAVEGHRLSVVAPLMQMNKAEIIRLGLSLGVDYSLTSSCYDPSPSGNACARCDSCALRRAGFEANRLTDPVLAC